MTLTKKPSFFGKMQQKIEDVILLRPKVDEEMLEDLEEALIASDIGMNTAIKIVEELKAEVRAKRIVDADGVRSQIKAIVKNLIDKGQRLHLTEETPLVIMVIGVNGSGKTTSIAKLAKKMSDEGKSVLLVAADTFRAAAAEQLSIWGERLSVPVIKHKEGADPSAVIFDGLSAAKARHTDVIICDTAGRLQTKKNLMVELSKMYRIIQREHPDAARETLLVLDATTGKNAVSQAKEFGEITELTGIILTKLDGTAKGGIVITIADEFDLPVKFVGTGEGMDDFKEFNPEEFADSIFEG
ncbi:MAG: signal recognition particle-docking protein FtsY [Clostridia bacterium]|nr:signal recognition particle-docking protein FtsY [Clostridia bacterium]